MSLEEITELIDSKIEKNPNCIVFTWFEIRVRKNLTEEQTDDFLRLARNRLENLNYKVYFTGAKFVYENDNPSNTPISVFPAPISNNITLSFNSFPSRTKVLSASVIGTNPSMSMSAFLKIDARCFM